jgi:3-phosphoshikimate 1-carboxyvinyltransferase
MRINVRRSGPLKGEVVLPGDKSISHRAVLLGAMARGESRFDGFLAAGVTRVMLDAVRQLGVRAEVQGEQLILESPGMAGWVSPVLAVDCGHSATTLRLLAGALAGANLDAVLDGSRSLRQRPMARVVDPLVWMGARIASSGGCAPLRLTRRPEDHPLRGLTHQTRVASAQVKSALLLAGLGAAGPTTVIEPGPSRDHTERMLSAMGVPVQREILPDGRPQVTLLPDAVESLQPLRAAIPGDFSAAAFLLAAGAILPGSSLRFPGVGLNWTRTGMLDTLVEMGAVVRTENPTRISNEKTGTLFLRQAALDGVEVSGDRVVRMIDEFPAFAVAAAFARGTTTVRDAEELRVKESDRIRGICDGLARLGVDVIETADGFRIDGNPADLPGGVTLDPARDHRLAMAFVLAGLRCKAPVVVEGAEIISQSFPGFIETLQSLGAETIEVEDA